MFNQPAEEIMKIVKTRDSATTILRKLGVTSRDYSLFIGKNPSGLFEVDADAASKHVAKPDVPKAGYSGVDPLSSPASNAAKVKKVRRVSVSARARELILAGKSNADTWSALKAEFKLTEDKKHYPSWYRSQLRRTGQLPKRVK